MATDEACHTRRYNVADVRVEVETWVGQERTEQVQGLSKSEQGVAIVGCLFGRELDEVGYKLMDGRIGTEGGKGGKSVFFVGGVEDGDADAIKVEVEFFGDDMLHQGLDADIVEA